MEALYDVMFGTLEAAWPMTVRQMFYALVSAGAIAKTEQEYKAVGRGLIHLRLEGVVPFHWVADNTRWMRKPTTYDSADAALRDTVLGYRRALWTGQDAYVEVWLGEGRLDRGDPRRDGAARRAADGHAGL